MDCKISWNQTRYIPNVEINPYVTFMYFVYNKIHSKVRGKSFPKKKKVRVRREHYTPKIKKSMQFISLAHQSMVILNKWPKYILFKLWFITKYFYQI